MLSGCVHLVFESLDTRPSAHHKRVVCGDHGDDADAHGFELVIVLEVAREVVRMTGRLVIMSRKQAIERGWLRTVNAPGTANNTTFFPAHSLAMS